MDAMDFVVKEHFPPISSSTSSTSSTTSTKLYNSTIRKARTASGAITVQVVRNEGKKRTIIMHVGRAHGGSECALASPGTTNRNGRKSLFA